MRSSVRLRLSLWYLLAFGGLLIAFSAYVLSSLSRDLRSGFDKAITRTADTTASYFEEFAERKNPTGGALETVRELRFGKAGVAIFRGNDLLAATSDGVVGIVRAKDLIRASGSGNHAIATDSPTNSRAVAVSLQIDSVTYTIAVVESMQELTDEIRRMREVVLLAIPRRSS